MSRPRVDYSLGKRCCDCRAVKPPDEFYLRRDRRQGAGLDSRCKKCANRNRVRDRWRAQNGMPAADYLGMVIVQCGTCAVCGETETASSRTRSTGPRRGTRRLNVDHNHETGQIRGLLCSRCNTGLGLLGDNPDLLRRAAAYLEEYADVLRN
jgi:hypothetical protein